LTGVVLVIADAHQGLVDSIAETRVTWQRLSHPLLVRSLGQGGGVTSSPRVATLVRTIVDQLGRHQGHSFSSNGSPRRWLGSCLRMAEHLE